MMNAARMRSSVLHYSVARRGFTVIELCAVLAIVILLAATFVPYALSLREAANRQRCVENLNKIYWALSQYGAENHYAYPRVRADERLGGRWTAFTGADDANPFAPDSAVRANDVSASLWLLVRAVDADPRWFICPSSSGRADPLTDAAGRSVPATSRGNFRGASNLTYGYASPFSAVSDYVLNDTLPASFVLVADQGPPMATLTAVDGVPAFGVEPAALAQANSVNHRRAGQNVLYASGAVFFEASPYSGVGRTTVRGAAGSADGDNIYTALAPTPLISTQPKHNEPGTAGTGVGPAYRYDTYLVPTAGFLPVTVIATPPPAAATTPAPRPVPLPPATAPAPTPPVPGPTPLPAAATAPATTQAP